MSCSESIGCLKKERGIQDRPTLGLCMSRRTAKVADFTSTTMQGLNGITREAAAALPKEWGWRSIRWGWVFKYQDWMNLLLTVGFVVGLLVANSAQSLNIRPFLTYDATISYYYRASSTIPYWVATVIPLALMIISFAVGEIALAKGWHGFITSAVASLMHFTIDGISAFVVTGFVTQVTKVGVGQLRPDFLARCQPTPIPTNVQIEIGASAAANPACTPGVVSESELKDGHYSFPSGHTSTVFSFAVYSSVYCIYALYCRMKQQHLVHATGSAAPQSASSSSSSWDNKPARRTWAGRWLSDSLYLLGFVWILVQMGFAWGVGASRVIDNKHHVSDVMSGAFLGSAVALLYVLRAIPRHRRLDELDVGDAIEAPTPLLQEAEGGGHGVQCEGTDVV